MQKEGTDVLDRSQCDLTGPLQLIDFEYSCAGYRGFDWGNHFNEYAGWCFSSLLQVLPASRDGCQSSPRHAMAPEALHAVCNVSLNDQKLPILSYIYFCFVRSCGGMGAQLVALHANVSACSLSLLPLLPAYPVLLLLVSRQLCVIANSSELECTPGLQACQAVAVRQLMECRVVRSVMLCSSRCLLPPQKKLNEHVQMGCTSCLLCPVLFWFPQAHTPVTSVYLCSDLSLGPVAPRHCTYACQLSKPGSDLLC